jgi:GWxTD domain-containing protein
LKKFLISFILVYSSIFGQSDPNNPEFFSKLPFNSEIISLPRTDGDFSVSYIYRIPYQQLVFEKQAESFTAGFRVVVEITDDDSKLVSRDIKDSRVSVSSFEETHEISYFLQDYLSFKLKPGEYKITATISDMNSTGEVPIKPIKLNLKKYKDKIVQNPFVIAAREIFCDEQRAFILANTGGNIPFSSEKFHLIIPVTDTSITELNVEIENDDQTLISTTIEESHIIPVGITECERYLSITRDSETVPLKNFVLRDVNNGLHEGEIILKIKNKEYSIDEEFKSNIVWFTKPFSLMDPEKAIEFLNYIETDSVVSSLLKNRSSKYPEILKQYWSKFDPTPETTYNEVMFEYYSRVDYAIKEFRGIGKNNGAKSDRGVVYIKFGKPDKIERSSNPQGQMMEIWTYSKSDRTFSFVDKKGTGNFTITEN